MLETDRPWAVYALADLEPGSFEYAHWFCAASDEQALALFFSGFATPVLITVGKAGSLRSVLNELIDELNPRKLYAVVKPDVMPLLTGRFDVIAIIAKTDPLVIFRSWEAFLEYRPDPIDRGTRERSVKV